MTYQGIHIYTAIGSGLGPRARSPLPPGATGEAFNEMSMGPSTEVEQNQLTPEEKEEASGKSGRYKTMAKSWIPSMSLFNPI